MIIKNMALIKIKILSLSFLIIIILIELFIGKLNKIIITNKFFKKN